ncbi:c-type cytochrome biogenesis protein CcsB [Ammoniphilus sp. CFH 90114]|uniref:c-type cytochrome biogenesis protein CcsB n=1 Tax=Ammoniphilus sp. CFH 90114 TaxID=2493665 RepID=UPI00100DD2C9|nr:c-type cytochrome biogenesis protein CcsB [Ammoniphilus sp. CFH 90114]RXT13856.1 c-type cytochrome biogenesis protein CcsB [Ammoniphilus sp. CFH 90114]
MIALSGNLLLFAFISYVLSSIAFVISVTGKRWSDRSPEQHKNRWGWIGFGIAVIGFLFQTGFIITRWIAGGHFPTSNMFEFMAFLAYSIILAFIIIFLVYRITVIGAFVMPVGIIMLAYASVFPREIQPLIPALQSYWLKIHVTTAALGEGAFAVGFAAGLMYLVRTVNQEISTRSTKWLEATLCMVLMLVGFIITTMGFSASGYQATFQTGGNGAPMSEVIYQMPAIAGPQDATLVTEGVMKPLFETPSWMQGVNAGRKLNTLLWSILTGLILYGLIRLATRRRLGQLIHPLVRDLDPETIDEISYRAIAIGFPIFTLGALIFAMIWAAEAWGRFWGWDPKEVWALITWLFYSAYLHLRLSKGWQGERSAWMAVIGFIVVMITLVFVNLVIVGLHSYA